MALLVQRPSSYTLFPTLVWTLMLVFENRSQGMIEAMAPLVQQQHGGGEAVAVAGEHLRGLWHECVDGVASIMARDESMRRRMFTRPVIGDAEPPPALPSRDLWWSLAVRTLSLCFIPAQANS